MCGIAGVVGRQEPVTWDGHPIHRMLAAIVHRGPDESRAEQRGAAVLGTVRLAQVDRLTSRQPMVDPTGRYVLSFNGEIYNHADLRRSLEREGSTFRTSGDTEVLLHALVRWGRDALPRLRGQFALALWDSAEGRLLLARDRFGIVPLFWTRGGDGVLAFASEVKALRAGGLRAELAVADVVDAGVLWGLHPGRSLFAGVSSVPPGGVVTVRGHEVDVDRYWRPVFAEERDRSSLAEQAEHLRHLLGIAVARRVPQYGDPAVLLSGGLDSTAVLALLREQHPGERIDSYSIEFERSALDERAFQALVAERMGTTHRSVRCTEDSIAADLVRAIEHAEVPLIRTAPASSIALAALIEREGTRTVLSGEGADELFCGYDLFKLAATREAWGLNGDSPEVAAGLGAVLDRQRAMGRSVDRTFYERGIEGSDDPLFSHLPRWSASSRLLQYLAPDVRRARSADALLSRVRDGLPPEASALPAVERGQLLEAAYFLPSALLGSQCDRPFMAHSIEARYPFLDEDVVDFALTLPLGSKLAGDDEKRVLKQAVRGRIPDEVVSRVKQPYTAPEGEVFRTAAGAEILDHYLSAPALEKAGVFDPKRVAWLVRKLRTTRTSFHDDLALLWMVGTQVLADTYGVADRHEPPVKGEVHA